MIYAVRLVVAGRTVRFVTDHSAAHDYVRQVNALHSIQPYEVIADDPSERLPTVRYSAGSPCQAQYDAKTMTLSVVFPWVDDPPDVFGVGEPHRNLLQYSMRMPFEQVRQERGEYRIHSSAVIRDGHAIVFAGDAEAGKTTAALHLCHEFGFAFYANDHTVLSTRDGHPWVIHGDGADLNLRFSSVLRYSPALAERTFGARSADVPWNLKREVAAHELGIGASADPVPLKLFVKIRLDDTIDDCVIDLISRGAALDVPPARDMDVFRAKAAFYREMTEIIRGAEFTPLHDTEFSLLDLYMPDLDEPRFLTNRVRFLNTLFDEAQAAVLSVRGPLEASAQAIVELFEALPDRDGRGSRDRVAR